MFHEKPSSTAKVVNDHYSRLPTPIVRSLFPILDVEKQVDLPVNNFKPSSFGKLVCLQLRLKFGKTRAPYSSSLSQKLNSAAKIKTTTSTQSIKSIVIRKTSRDT